MTLHRILVFIASLFFLSAQPDEILVDYSSNEPEDINFSEENQQLINLTCLIRGVYPQPQVQLTWKQSRFRTKGPFINDVIEMWTFFDPPTQSDTHFCPLPFAFCSFVIIYLTPSLIEPFQKVLFTPSPLLNLQDKL